MLGQRMSENEKLTFHLLSVFVGALVIFVFLVATTGSVQNAVTSLMFLAICTLGIGIALLGAIAWLIGLMIVAPIWGIIWGGILLYKYRNSGEGETSADRISQASTSIAPNPTLPRQESVPLTSQQMALVKYMKQGKDKYGWSDTQIANRLRFEGWSNQEIEEALGIFNNTIS
ncbi:hypothetical protein H6S82_19395 [Planktothrix sp. FACHB-1355]|uniref:Uncharacterized protein n=1 Tax=Aerosakkonema funiforme FACHB-1375 TaxID=2949571 RepID=A0A926VJW1_9CYAN|nr:MULTISPECIES: hypothetical protein [Oscillatoriales]MBD2185160.1 hypothetical protein [Aerosakkonema funiforme FACHB-1375]MBD3561000.1 hypothetical protein [Planktothrix sp. FACHB-1355]